jgi:hypothetical protein
MSEMTEAQEARLTVLAERLETARGYVAYLEDLDTRCKDSDPEAWEKLLGYRVEDTSEEWRNMADAIVTWAELAASDPELYAMLLRVDRFAEPLRTAMLTAIHAVLDVLEAAVITSLEVEARDALATVGSDDNDDA